MNSEQEKLLENYLLSLDREFVAVDLSLQMKSNLGNARKYYSKVLKRKRMDLVGYDGIAMKELNTFVYLLRLVSKDKEGADKIPDEHPMWDSLLALKREARLSVRQDPIIVQPYGKYTTEELALVESLLANYKDLELFKNEKIEALLISIHKKQRRLRRTKGMIKYRKIEYGDIDFIALFSSSLKDKSLADYNGMELKGLIAKILKRREKRWEITPRGKERSLPKIKIGSEENRKEGSLTEKKNASWIQKLFHWS